ncbi:uncharacterized protein LOC131285520 [Anopheles ziemanni]|uniref:uncharacterized protein LOC131266962 n=1 Tax=Anopheles coustani TaxID=139045 RepID=UPI002659AE5E|nr:uncharacterized protein LOC131266962 [Anopheles coustani]XP_058170361.1 uncharacterized protein LOC131285520 [Anopheles ziemanni]
MSDLDRMKKTGNFSRRVAKYLKMDLPVDEEAGSSGLMSQQLHAVNPSDSTDLPSEPQEHQGEGSIHSEDPNLTDYLESSDDESFGSEEDYKSFDLLPLLVCVRKTTPSCSQLSLNVSIDGLPLHKSTTLQYWPILFNINELPRVPVMAAGIFYGLSKPENIEQYLRPLVDEINFLIEHGIIINGKKLFVKLRAIIADTPARSFVKGTVGHTGYAGCMKCVVEGQYSREGRTVVFPGVGAPKRTDKGFRENAYPKHCKMISPLLDLKDFDIINDVIVADRLHLIDLGVMKRLLIGWRDGSLGKVRWSTSQCSQISKALGNIKLPAEIHRPLRPVVYAGKWKGSEFASFLHYASIVVLKEHLPQECYQHFLLLFCAVTILSSRVYRPMWSLAGQMLERFVTQYSHVYGERYIGSNVHNLQHVYEEVARLEYQLQSIGLQAIWRLVTFGDVPLTSKLVIKLCDTSI